MQPFRGLFQRPKNPFKISPKFVLKFFQKSVDNYHNLSYTVQAVARNDKAKPGCGVLAQLGEHLPYKQRVTGSSPVGPTTYQISYGGIAQMARAHGSYPWCREFESPFRY
jgi:hypothetical protein